MKLKTGVVVDIVDRADLSMSGMSCCCRRQSDAVEGGDDVNDVDLTSEAVEDRDEDDDHGCLSLGSCGCVDRTARKSQHCSVGIHEEVVNESDVAANVEDQSDRDLYYTHAGYDSAEADDDDMDYYFHERVGRGRNGVDQSWDDRSNARHQTLLSCY